MISIFDISNYDKEIFLEHLFKSLPYYIFWKNRESVLGGDENFLNFKDTSKGISNKILLKVFDLYFSDTPHGAGIGLAFSKEVMESFSGDIICESEEEKYTHFILKFPSLENSKSFYLEKTHEI